LLILLRVIVLIFVITVLVARYCTFQIVFSYSAIQPQLCNKLIVHDVMVCSMEPHRTATESHLPCGITQCYLAPDTSEHTRLNPSQTGRYSIYLPRRDGRL